jgi:hypothetical protein
MIAARLSDVAPDGKITRVSFGVLNLTHRDGHAHPEPLVPGQKYFIRLQLNHIGQAFDPGHRVRLALSTSYWPIAWPPPELTTLGIHLGASRLILPERPLRDEAPVRFEPPEGTPPTPETRLRSGEEAWRVIRDLATGTSALEVVNDEGRVYLEPLDLAVETRSVERYVSRLNDPASLEGSTEWRRLLERDGWTIETRAAMNLTSSPDAFRLRAEIDVWEGDTRIFCRSWDIEIPRELV